MLYKSAREGLINRTFQPTISQNIGELRGCQSKLGINQGFSSSRLSHILTELGDVDDV